MVDAHQPLGVGFIGSGRIARAHLKAAQNLSDVVRVAAIVGRRRDKAEAVAREYGIPAVHDDYRQLLADPAVHTVVVTTPIIFYFLRSTKPKLKEVTMVKSITFMASSLPWL